MIAIFILVGLICWTAAVTAHTPSTQVLRAMGIGGLLGCFLVALLLWSWVWLPVGVAVFVGTAVLSAAIDQVIAAIRNQREK